MKKFWSGIGLAVVLVMAVGLAGCGTGLSPSGLSVNLNNQQTGIWVTGQGEILVVPDIVNLSLGISAQAKSVAEAQSLAANAMDKVMAALTQSGVAKKDIQTQNFAIQQVTRYDRDRQEEQVIGYRVTNMVIARIRDINKAGSTVDAVSLAGGDLTRVNSVTFAVDNPSKYHSEVRQKAMEDASAKARQLADLGKVTLGKPTLVSENLVAPIPRPVFEARAAVPMPAPAPITPISPGEMKITLSVQVAYAIQN